MNILTLPLAVPEGWAELRDVDKVEALLVYVVWPVLLFVVITVLALLPSLAKRASGGDAVEAEWFGGPRKSGDQLAGPDGDDSQAGGAGARW